MVRAGLVSRAHRQAPRASYATYVPAHCRRGLCCSPRCRSCRSAAGGPNVGFLMLIAWRLLRADPWPAWWAAPLGFVNDLFTGAPRLLGRSVERRILAIDLVDRRRCGATTGSNGYIAAVLIMVASWSMADRRLTGAPVPLVHIVPAIVIAILAFPLAAWLVGAARSLAAGAMRRPQPDPRITGAHQSFTFSRRMVLLGGAQVARRGLVGRMGYLSIAENEQYNAVARATGSSFVVPPRRGWIVDRNGKPIAINRATSGSTSSPTSSKSPSGRRAAAATARPPRRRGRAHHHGTEGAARAIQPVPVAENVPFEKYAAVTVRLPELPGVAPLRGFSRFYPDGRRGRPSGRLCRHPQCQGI